MRKKYFYIMGGGVAIVLLALLWPNGEVILDRPESEPDEQRFDINNIDQIKKRYDELYSTYEGGYVKQRHDVSLYLKESGTLKQYRRLKFTYNYLILADIVDGPDAMVYKYTLDSNKQRREKVIQMFGVTHPFAAADFEDPDAFWEKYKTYILAHQDVWETMVAEKEAALEFPDYVKEQAYLDAKYGLLLEMIYAPFIGMKTGKLP